MNALKEMSCQRNLIAAYIDGELDVTATLRFEAHLDDCASCRAELRAHRLFVCELDAAMTGSAEIPVPLGFSRMVAVRAVNDMRGVRSRSENRKALAICVILALAGFALIGARARYAIFVVAEKFVSASMSLISFILAAFYDTVAGLVVIVRVLSRKIIVESGSAGGLVVVLAVAVLILSRLISGYHRTGATE